jgi:hypothetical protein
MDHAVNADRFASDLQADIMLAGRAWACPYASSDEFEAAILRSKRAAGAFGAMRRRYMIYAGATTSVLAALVLIF